MNPLEKIRRHLATLWVVALGCIAAGAWAQQGTPAAVPQNSIDALQVSQQGGITIVKLTLKQALAVQPASFSIATPARIAFDFPGMANGLGRNAQQVNEGDLRSINIVQVGDRTRLVLNLNQMATYETRLEGNAMVISFAPKAAVASGAVPMVSHFAAARPQEVVQSVRDINFRRGKSGEARITVELSDPNVGIDIRKQGADLVVDFRKTSLPDKLNQRLDVTDFATPVTSIVTQPLSDNVRMVISPHGLWEHNAYQSDNQFVVEVRPLVENPNKLVQGSGSGAQGEKLSLNFQNIDVRAVLQVIADFTNFNIITSDTVSGNVTLRLKDVPWDQALDIILQAKGLGMRKNGNVIWIAPRQELSLMEQQELDARKQTASLEQPQSETFALSYQKADQLKATLTGNLLSKDGAIISDPETNTLFIKDTPSRLQSIREFIKKVDVGSRQVLIEARLVSAEDNFGRSLGVRLGYNDLSSTIPGAGVGSRVPGTNSTFGTVGGSLEGVFALTGQTTGGGTATGTAPTLAQSTFVNLPASPQGGAAPSTLAISLFKSGLASFINLELQAAETDGRVKNIASPRVVTADKKTAEISQGTQIPYQSATSSGATSTQFRDAVLKLSVTPQITPAGTVILELDVSQDTVGQVFAAGVSINKKQIKTKVTVENGGTVVLGGIFEQSETDTTNKVPLLGDIPVIGGLFSSNMRSKSRKELLYFITPRIIDEQIQAGIR